MGHETSKALRRRLRDPIWAERIMVGDALDIGAGSDGLGRQIGLWPLLRRVDEWDRAEGDAQYLRGVPVESYDLVYSSHTLEHMVDTGTALQSWWGVLKPGGHMVVVVPAWDLYEHKQFPSRFNADHKQTFDADDLLDLFHGWDGELLKIEKLTAHFDPSLPATYDQTQGLAECAWEIVVRRPDA